MRVVVLTPDAEAFSDEAQSVSLMTESGALQIFPGHASLQGSILFSPLRIEMADRQEDFVVQRGFLFINQEKDEVKIQVYRCEKQEEMSYASIKEYLEFLLQSLSNPEALGAYHLRHLEDERLATQTRLDVLEEEKKAGSSL